MIYFAYLKDFTGSQAGTGIPEGYKRDTFYK
jgi:hypothetical protein